MGWEPISYLSLDSMLLRPVEAGLWKQHETFDGTYTADDLLDALEILDVRAVNSSLAQDYYRRTRANT